MGFWDLIDRILRFCERGLENYAWIIFGVVIVFVIFIISLLWGFAIYKGDPPEKFSNAYLTITKNAPEYCRQRGFNSWDFVNRADFSDDENKIAENLTFECMNTKNETANIENFLKTS